MTTITYDVKVGHSITPFEIKETTSTDQAFGVVLDFDKFKIEKDFHRLPNIDILSTNYAADGTGVTVIANSESILASDISFGEDKKWYKVQRLNNSSTEIYVDTELWTAYDDDFIYCYGLARLFEYKTDGILEDSFIQTPIEIFPLKTNANLSIIALDGKFRHVSKANGNIKITFSRPASDDSFGFVYEVVECANFKIEEDVITTDKCSFKINDIKYTLFNTNKYKIAIDQFINQGFTLDVLLYNDKLEYIARQSSRIFSSNEDMAVTPTISIVADKTLYSGSFGTLDVITQTLPLTLDELNRLLIGEAEASGAIYLGTISRVISDNDINLVTYMKKANLKEDCYEYATQDIFGSAIVAYGDTSQGKLEFITPDSCDIVNLSKDIQLQTDILAEDQLFVDTSLIAYLESLEIPLVSDMSLLVNNNPYEVVCTPFDTNLPNQILVTINSEELNLADESIVVYNDDIIIEDLELDNQTIITAYINTTPVEIIPAPWGMHNGNNQWLHC